MRFEQRRRWDQGERRLVERKTYRSIVGGRRRQQRVVVVDQIVTVVGAVMS